uniref:Uncharacterized protein n=1 Tax=Glossina pallidipes TaxID=7398 RepID=A0A1A9ZMB7_GLOPL
MEDRSLLTKAAIRLNSPAITVAHTICASFLALSPGLFRLLPRTPSKSRQAPCAGKQVPPPTVPTSSDGIVQVMYKSSLLSPRHAIRVEQLLDVTFWAGSWPVARNTAVTMLAA